MISLGLKRGFEAPKTFQHPTSMTHPKVSKENELKAGLTDELLRLSVGIEDAGDILADLEKGLKENLIF